MSDVRWHNYPEETPEPLEDCVVVVEQENGAEFYDTGWVSKDGRWSVFGDYIGEYKIIMFARLED